MYPAHSFLLIPSLSGSNDTRFARWHEHWHDSPDVGGCIDLLLPSAPSPSDARLKCPIKRMRPFSTLITSSYVHATSDFISFHFISFHFISLHCISLACWSLNACISSIQSCRICILGPAYQTDCIYWPTMLNCGDLTALKYVMICIPLGLNSSITSNPLDGRQQFWHTT